MLSDLVPSFRNIAKVGLSFSMGITAATISAFWQCMQDKGDDERALCFPEERAIAVTTSVVIVWAGILMCYVVYDDGVALWDRLGEIESSCNLYEEVAADQSHEMIEATGQSYTQIE